MEKLNIKFSALKVDFDSPGLYFLGSRKPVHEGSKSGIPIKVILPFLASLSSKQLQRGIDMLAITTSTSNELFVVSTSMTLKDPELPK